MSQSSHTLSCPQTCSPMPKNLHPRLLARPTCCNFPTTFPNPKVPRIHLQPTTQNPSPLASALAFNRIKLLEVLADPVLSNPKVPNKLTSQHPKPYAPCLSPASQTPPAGSSLRPSLPSPYSSHINPIQVSASDTLGPVLLFTLTCWM